MTRLPPTGVDRSSPIIPKQLFLHCIKVSPGQILTRGRPRGGQSIPAKASKSAFPRCKLSATRSRRSSARGLESYLLGWINKYRESSGGFMRVRTVFPCPHWPCLERSQDEATDQGPYFVHRGPNPFTLEVTPASECPRLLTASYYVVHLFQPSKQSKCHLLSFSVTRLFVTCRG
jgi:hypothetical protein